jgi:hypothetical protein
MGVRSYGQFCPVAVACEVLTERLMSPSLLSKRLKILQRAGIIERCESEYVLTEAGEELRPIIIESIGMWGYRWSPGVLDPRNLDASLLMWDIQRRIVTENLPSERVVVHFHVTGSTDKKSRFWLVLDGEDVDLCLTDPGFPIDVSVTGHIQAMTRYWLGVAEIHGLIGSGDLALDGPRDLVRGFPSWFSRSVFATAEHHPALSEEARR